MNAPTMSARCHNQSIISQSNELIMLQNDVLSKTSNCLTTLGSIIGHEGPGSMVDSLTSQLVEVISIISKSCRLAHKISAKEEAHVSTIQDLKLMVQRQKTALEFYRKPCMVECDTQTDTVKIIDFDHVTVEKEARLRAAEMMANIEQLTTKNRSVEECCKILKTENKKLRRIILHEHRVIEAQQKMAHSMASCKSRVRLLSQPTIKTPSEDVYENADSKSIELQRSFDEDGRGYAAEFDSELEFSKICHDEITTNLRQAEVTSDKLSLSPEQVSSFPSRSSRSWYEIEESVGAIKAPIFQAPAFSDAVKLTIPGDLKTHVERPPTLSTQEDQSGISNQLSKGASLSSDIRLELDDGQGEGSFSVKSDVSASIPFDDFLQHSQIGANDSISMHTDLTCEDSIHNANGDELRASETSMGMEGGEQSFLSSPAASGLWDGSEDVEDSFALVQRYYAPDM